MLSELCECVLSLLPFNVDVDDALGVYDASAAFGVYAARGNCKSGLNTFTSFDAPCHMTHRGGGVRARAYLCLTGGKPATKEEWRSANLKLCLEATTSNVKSDFRPRTTYRTVQFIFALED